MFVTPDYDKYGLVAEKIRAIFREYDPQMRSHSLDEALLNVTDVLAERLGLDDPAAAPAEGEKEGAAPRGAQAAAGDTRIPGESPRETGASGGSGARGASRCGGGLSGDAETGRRRDAGSGGMGMEEEDEDNDWQEEEEEEDNGCGVSRRRKSPREERRARLFEAARALAEEIRGRIKEATKLTASVGVGPNFMLAKVRHSTVSIVHSLPASVGGSIRRDSTSGVLSPLYELCLCRSNIRERYDAQTNAFPPRSETESKQLAFPTFLGFISGSGGYSVRCHRSSEGACTHVLGLFLLVAFFAFVSMSYAKPRVFLNGPCPFGGKPPPPLRLWPLAPTVSRIRSYFAAVAFFGRHRLPRIGTSPMGRCA